MTHITKTGRVYVDGKRRSPGWRKGWMYENVYGWEWLGPSRWDGLVDLVVLPYEPDAATRAKIEKYFANATPPNNEQELK
jgi:hypothetical protein